MFLGDISFNAAPLAPQHSLRRAEGKKPEGRLCRPAAHRLMGCASVATLDGVKRRQPQGARSLAALTIKFCENLH